MVIAVYENGRKIGWVKSVNETKGFYQVTDNLKSARKNFKTLDEVQGIIDYCAAIEPRRGYIVE